MNEEQKKLIETINEERREEAEYYQFVKDNSTILRKSKNIFDMALAYGFPMTAAFEFAREYFNIKLDELEKQKKKKKKE